MDFWFSTEKVGSLKHATEAQSSNIVPQKSSESRVPEIYDGVRMSRSPGRWSPDSSKKRNQKLAGYFTIGSKGRRVGFAIFPKTISMYLWHKKIPKSIENFILENNSLTLSNFTQKVVP